MARRTRRFWSEDEKRRIVAQSYAPGAVGIDPSVERVLQHRNHVAVADRRPVEGDHCPAIRWAREAELFFRQRQEHLPRAAQGTKPREDVANRFLNANIGIQAEPGLGIPDVTDRDADAKLAARRLEPGGVVHPGAQHAEFELAD